VKTSLNRTFINGIQLPTVRNIEEAIEHGADFRAVLTAGPAACEVDIAHPNHRVWEFDDSPIAAYAASRRQVEEMITWGCEQSDLLVHCHAGMSRSTAVAWGVAMARGISPAAALAALHDAHPVESYGEKRLFIPNVVIVQYLEDLLDQPGLRELRDDVVGSGGW